MPVIHLLPEQDRETPQTGIYRCPVYKVTTIFPTKTKHELTCDKGYLSHGGARGEIYCYLWGWGMLGR